MKPLYGVLSGFNVGFFPVQVPGSAEPESAGADGRQRLRWDYHRRKVEAAATKRPSALSALASSTWGRWTLINIRAYLPSDECRPECSMGARIGPRIGDVTACFTQQPRNAVG